MITPSIDQQGLRVALAELKEVEPNVVKDLRTSLRQKVGPYAREIAASVPVEPPLSGFANNGATSWASVRGSVSFTPGRSRKTGNHLVSIRVTPAKQKRGVYIGEMAGMRTNGITRSGRALIRGLNARYPMIKRGGRWAFEKFRQTRPEFVALAITSVQMTTDKVNKKLVR